MGTGILLLQCMPSAILRILLEQQQNLHYVVTRDVQRGNALGDGPGHPRE